MFETSLIDVQKPRRAPHVWATAAGIHCALFATALSAAYWHIGPVAEPMENAVFIIQAALPEPPAAGTRVRTETPAPAPAATTPPETVQPKAEEVPATPPTHFETPAPPDTPGSSEILLASNSPDGDPLSSGGLGFGDGPIGGFDGPNHGSAVSGPGVVSDQPYKLSAAIARPVLVSRVDPVYPELARRIRQAGTVILETVIDENGRVTDVKVINGLGYGLEQAAIDAVSRWRFEPARMNGRAVKVFFNLTVQFSLR